MSWHTAGIAFKIQDGISDQELFGILGLTLGAAKGEVSFDEASSSMVEGRAVGSSGGWILVFDPMMFLSPTAPPDDFGNSMWTAELESRMIQASERADVFGFLLEGASGTAGFSLYSRGERRRLLMTQEDQVVFDIGDVLDEEKVAFAEEDDTEQRVLILAEKLGLDFSSARQMKTMFRLYDYAYPLDGPEFRKPKVASTTKKWWMFWK